MTMKQMLDQKKKNVDFSNLVVDKSHWVTNRVGEVGPDLRLK